MTMDFPNPGPVNKRGEGVRVEKGISRVGGEDTIQRRIPNPRVRFGIKPWERDPLDCMKDKGGNWEGQQRHGQNSNHYRSSNPSQKFGRDHEPKGGPQHYYEWAQSQANYSMKPKFGV